MNEKKQDIMGDEMRKTIHTVHELVAAVAVTVRDMKGEMGTPELTELASWSGVMTDLLKVMNTKIMFELAKRLGFDVEKIKEERACGKTLDCSSSRLS